jgi:hypothetical protein
LYLYHKYDARIEKLTYVSGVKFTRSGGGPHYIALPLSGYDSWSRWFWVVQICPTLGTLVGYY